MVSGFCSMGSPNPPEVPHEFLPQPLSPTYISLRRNWGSSIVGEATIVNRVIGSGIYGSFEGYMGAEFTENRKIK